MKIAVDLLSLAFGGSETYPFEMLPRLAESSNEFFVLLTKGKGGQLRDHVGDRVQIVNLPSLTANPFLRALYQRYWLPHWLRRERIDTLFVPGGLTTTKRRPGDCFRIVVMLRNMLPFDVQQQALFPFMRYPYRRFRYRLLARGLLQSFRTADRIVFISEYSKSIVGPLCNDSKCMVIPHGVGGSFRDTLASSDDILSRYRIRRPYLLYVSIFQPYKHQLEVIDGFRLYSNKGTSKQRLQLVLVGLAEGAYASRVLEASRGLAGHVLCTGRVPRKDIPTLLAYASILLFGSTCETCPNILLEYLSAAKPIICSNSKPMPEFGGDAVRYVDAKDAHEWCEAIAELQARKFLRSQMGERATLRAKRYSWDETGRKTLAALTDW